MPAGATGGRALMPSWRRFIAWWTADLPPLSGPLRFLFYGGLLFTTLFNAANPVRGLLAYEATAPQLFRTYGLVELLRVPYQPPYLVQAIIAMTVVAWVFAAVGFLSRFSAVVTAIGIVCLQGLFLGTNALNHNWFLPMYACVALCFARTNDRWSVDHFLESRGIRSSPSGPTSTTLADTGFARKLILVSAAGFYFASGYTKLATSGWRWVDGHTIAYFAEQRRGRYPLTDILADHLELAALLSALALVLEVGAVLLVVSRRARWVWVPGLLLMHVGIRISLGPAYWENVLCLLLLLDWRGLLRRISTTGFPGRRWLGSREDTAVEGAAKAGPRAPGGALAGAVAGSAFLLVLLGAGIFQIFWWPLTYVYMYSAYYSIPHDIRANHPTAAYEHVSPAQRIARSFLDRRTSREETEYLMNRVGLRLVSHRSDRFELTDHLGVHSWKQWVLTVGGPVLVRDLAAKPPGRIEFDPRRPDHPAQRFLASYAPVLSRHLPPGLRAVHERVEMTYSLGSGNAVIASVSLPAPEDSLLAVTRRSPMKVPALHYRP